MQSVKVNPVYEHPVLSLLSKKTDWVYHLSVLLLAMAQRVIHTLSFFDLSSNTTSAQMSMMPWFCLGKSCLLIAYTSNSFPRKCSLSEEFFYRLKTDWESLFFSRGLCANCTFSFWRLIGRERTQFLFSINIQVFDNYTATVRIDGHPVSLGISCEWKRMREYDALIQRIWIFVIWLKWRVLLLTLTLSLSHKHTHTLPRFYRVMGHCGSRGLRSLTSTLVPSNRCLCYLLFCCLSCFFCKC
jgi:hypothetical protein